MRNIIKGMLAAAALTALTSAPALAGSVALTNGGGWYEAFFAYPDTSFQDASGNDLDFTFTLTKTTTLLVADGGFSGDEFDVVINGKDAGDTSASIFDGKDVEYGPPTDDHECFSCAVYDPAYNTSFSHGEYVLPAGTYDVTGSALIGGQSGLSDLGFGGGAFGIALGAVPEPATWAMMLTGFFGLGAVLRRSRRLAVA
jgi:hypothetical protein